MALINHAKREINAKIVYYGREGTGKRESLQYIYDRIRPGLRGALKSPVNSGDSLFFFDFSPFETPVFDGYRIRFHVYTLTGAVANPAAWKMTLKGADGLVIVTDADPSAATESRESILDLRDYLAAYGVGLNETPCVVQIVRGVGEGDVAAEEIATSLGGAGIQACFSDPVRGTGVLDALSRLSRQVMARIGQNDALKAVALEVPPESAPEMVAAGTDPTVLEPLASTTVELEGGKGQVLPSPVDATDGACAVTLNVAGTGAECRDGIVKIPLDISMAGTTRRLVLSIAVEQA